MLSHTFLSLIIIIIIIIIIIMEAFDIALCMNHP